MEYFIFQKSPPSLLLTYFSIVIITMLLFNNSGDAATTLAILPKNETIPAVFVFGDSIVDPGNNNYIETIVQVNFPPYGRDFFGGKPTGRFSDGKVPSDLIAELFGVKELLPAYLSPNLQLQDFLSGVSFASGGSGYDPLTSQMMAVLSLTDQLKMFKNYIRRIKPEVGDNKTQTILSKSIYILCTGSDDIANTYYSTPFRRFQYDVPAYTDLMVNSATSFLKGLYGLGARRIGVVSVPAIGCVPSQRILGGGIERRCSEATNKAAHIFNSKLYLQMDSINRKFSDARLVYLDIFNPLLYLIQNPSKYGFEVVDKGCCGTGNLEVGILCNPFTPTSCANASEYLFWDSYHPSQQAYKVLNSLVFDKNMHKFF